MVFNKFKNKDCYFFQDEECVLHKHCCLLCSYKIKKIRGITETSDYLKIVIDRKNMTKSYYISIISIVISIMLLLFEIYKNTPTK